MKETKLVFVYGTLLSGLFNNVYLTESNLIGEYETAPEYEMLDNGMYPAIKEGADKIKGEVYEVDNATMGALDALESIAYDDYKKEEINIKGVDRPVYIYVGDKVFKMYDEWKPVANGDYRKHINK